MQQIGISSGRCAQKIGEIVFVRRREQHLRRTADAKPCQRRQRFIRQHPPAQLRHLRFQFAECDVGEKQP